MTVKPPSALPSGTVTLILADVVGSVRLWESDRKRMEDATSRLDEMVATTTRRHHGSRPLEQGEGDSFVAAFDRASNAIACALDLQRAFIRNRRPENAGLPVRLALHTGEVEVRSDGKYSGPTLNRCARLRDLAHGGQILVSQTTYDVGGDSMPDQVTLKDLGQYRLRDLARPERVYQLGHPDLPDRFPPLRSLDAVPNNLPLQLSSFIGRDYEMAEIRKLFTDNRMVTLTGAGGCGKTRLGLQFAAERIDEYPDGMWWVDLAPISDPRVVATKLAATLSVRESESESVRQTLVDQLRERHLGLILDNCEHLVAECAEVASALLRECPQVWILATSREPLGVEGEVSYRVPSLDFPEADTYSASELAEYHSVRLFVDRAKRVRPKFEMTDANALAISTICRRVDGIPLAIELAAARTQVLSPAEIAEAIRQRFNVLTGGARGALPRQRTLEASVDWSYGLLEEAERALLARLSVFHGTFTLGAAEAVCDGDLIHRERVLDLLAALVNKSLVQVEESGSESRYRLLETVRAYARQKLTDTGEAAEVRTRHLDYCVAVAERAAPELRGRGFSDWAARLTQDIDSLRAAMDWALSARQEGKHLRISAALLPFWIVRGLYSEVRRSLEAALSAEVEPAIRVKALATGAVISVFADQYQSAFDLGRECVSLAREIGDDHSLGWGLLYLGWAEHWLGRGGLDNVAEAGRIGEVVGDFVLSEHAVFYRGIIEGMTRSQVTAGPLLESGLAKARASGDDFALSTSTFFAGTIHWMGGRFAQARTLLEESAQISRRIENQTFLSFALGELGWTVAQQGDYPRAQTLCEEAFEIARQFSRTVEGNARTNLALVRWVRGDPDVLDDPQMVADPRRWEEIGLAYFLDWSNWALGAFSLSRGDHGEARAYLENAIEQARKHAFVWILGQALASLGRLHRAEGNPSAAESPLYEALEVLHRYGDQARICDVLESIAGVASDLESYEEAIRLFGAAARLRQEIGYVRFPVYRSAYEADVAKARDAVGEEDFDRIWAEGLALSSEEAVAFASRGRGKRKRPSVGWPSLTPTELEVVKLVAKGLSNPEIAKRMFVARDTVKAHLSHVFAKLGVSSRAELAAEAARRGV